MALLLHLLRSLLASLGPLAVAAQVGPVVGRRPVRERRLAVGITAAGADLPAGPKLDKLEDRVAFPVIDGVPDAGSSGLSRQKRSAVAPIGDGRVTAGPRGLGRGVLRGSVGLACGTGWWPSA